MVEPFKHDVREDKRYPEPAEETTVRLTDEYVDSLRHDPSAVHLLLYDVIGDLHAPEEPRDPKIWRPEGKKKVGEKDFEKLIRDWRHLDEFNYMLRTAVEWAVQNASEPHFDDVDYAVGKTKEWMTTYGRDFVDYDLWDPVLENTLWSNGREIMKELMRYLDLTHEPRGRVEVWLITFDPWKSQATKRILKERGLDETPMLEVEFGGIFRQFLSRFYTVLVDDMEGIEIDNRMNFKKFWKEVIGDQGNVFAARKEMLRYLEKR